MRVRKATSVTSCPAERSNEEIRTRLKVVQLLSRSSSSHRSSGRPDHSNRSRFAKTISHSCEARSRDVTVAGTLSRSEKGSSVAQRVATFRSSRRTSEERSGPGSAQIGVLRPGTVAIRTLMACETKKVPGSCRVGTGFLRKTPRLVLAAKERVNYDRWDVDPSDGCLLDQTGYEALDQPGTELGQDAFDSLAQERVLQD